MRQKGKLSFDGQTYKLSLLPAGILNPGVVSVIATGVVLNPKFLIDEMDQIASRAGEIAPARLRISDRAHVIFPYHMLEEAVLEKRRGQAAIGTTMRGIGTCYRDKASRTYAIRMGDLVRPDILKKRLQEVVADKNVILKALDPEFEPLDPQVIFEEYAVYADRLRPYVCDTTSLLHKAVADKKKLLFEGAQGSLLDLDHGTFPFVTSSSSSGCGIHPGSGVPERSIDKMIGIVKAYTTRVGGGPFPTELLDDIGQHIRDAGNEYGTVTGRPRRCGWLDAVATGYGARLSGVDFLAVMLLDVLTGLDELKICEAYEINGERTTDFPSQLCDLELAKPVYRSLSGWKEDVTGVTKLSDLPTAARRYLDAVAEIMGVPIEIVSVGPDRAQTIFV